MSAIASFLKLQESSLDGLREAALPQRRWWGAPRDNFHSYLSKHSAKVTNYLWSGYVFGTLLPYLDDKHGIDLMQSEHRELTNFLSATRQVTCFFFTSAHRSAYESKLAKDFPISELVQYYNEFNNCNEPEVGQAMVDGINAIRKSLEQLSMGSVVLLIIG